MASNIPPPSSSSSSSPLSSAGLLSLGGPNYRVQWSDHYNSAWAFEDCDAIAIREGTQNLFEHLIASKEIIITQIKPTPNPTVNLPDYESDSPTTRSEQKDYVLSQLFAQLDLASTVSLESPFFVILRKRLLVTLRILHAIHTKFHLVYPEVFLIFCKKIL